jgi:hypothetical protein
MEKSFNHESMIEITVFQPHELARNDGAANMCEQAFGERARMRTPASIGF